MDEKFLMRCPVPGVAVTLVRKFSCRLHDIFMR
jgi:hypothetical protein